MQRGHGEDARPSDVAAELVTRELALRASQHCCLRHWVRPDAKEGTVGGTTGARISLG